MVETKYDTSHHRGATPEARINNRLRNSGGEEADHIVKTGSGAQRVFHNIHHGANMRQHGPDAKCVGIDGKMRGPASHGDGR
jgi:hypothetical protein